MATDDERDPVEETPPSDSTAADATPEDAAELTDDVDSVDDPDVSDDSGDTELDPDDDELEIDDPDALERATEQVSEADPDSDDDLVEEPTDAELARLTEGPDATARAGDRDGEPDGNGSADRELVGVGAATRRSTAKAKTAEQDDKKGRAEKKGKATPKRDGSAPTHKRTGPVTFVKESVGELRKVVYPTGPQLLQYFVVVLIFVLFIIAIVSVLDLAFGWAILKIFS